MQLRPLMYVCAAMALAAPGVFAKSTAPKQADDGKPFVQTGMASWYGSEFKGHKTASGERYDPESLTGAHRKLPFNTLVCVTNLRNNRSVIVRINNRGPYIKSRIIDVSRAAARKLDMMHSGVARVRIEKFTPDKGAQKAGG